MAKPADRFGCMPGPRQIDNPVWERGSVCLLVAGRPTSVRSASLAGPSLANGGQSTSSRADTILSCRSIAPKRWASCASSITRSWPCWLIARAPFLGSNGANLAAPVVLMAQRLVGRPSGPQSASVGSARTMPVAAARTIVIRDSERRNRAAVGLVAGRIHRDGTRRRTGHSRRSHATIASSSRRSMAALTLRIAPR
jgi:hypothetical protein